MQCGLITFKASPVAAEVQNLHYRIDEAQGFGEERRNKGPRV